MSPILQSQESSPVPFVPTTDIFDDALVFSDDRRMQRMFDILNMAARNVQVLILTCREQLFEELGGRALSLTAGHSEDLLSP